VTAKLDIASAQHTDKGKKEENQDFHGIVVPDNEQLETKGIAAAIADGVSGSAAGREASESSVSGFLNDYYSTPDSWTVKTSITKVLNSINRWLYRQSEKTNYTQYDHVTTFTGTIFKSTTAHIFHSGDSRIYRYRGDDLEQLTRDHRIIVSETENYLSRALGIELHIEIDYRQVSIQRGDLFLYTTDGIHDFLDDKSIKSILQDTSTSLNEKCKTLISQSLDNNSSDNLTSQIIEITSVPNPNDEEFYSRLTKLPFPPDLAIGNIIDGYKILRDIHQSKRSQCYIAIDTENDEKVVIKTPSVNYEDDIEYINSFLREEWIGKRINNAHVLRTHEHARKRTFLYQVTEFIDCKTLRIWMNDNPHPPIDAVRDLIEQVAKGLQALHRLEMIHRDLKPENIIIDQYGVVKIIDFGSVKISGDTEIATPFDQNSLVGTIDYTAPEYLSGSQGTEKSDQFSLGVLTYELLSAKLPFKHPAAERSLRRRKYIPLIEHDVEIPAWIEGAIKRTLLPEPNDRYNVISEFIYDLSHANKNYIDKEFKPLLERNPLKFWKLIAGFLFVSNIILLIMLMGK